MSFPFGFNLVGYTRAEMGLGEAARSLARAMEVANLPFGLVNLAIGNPGSHLDLSLAHLEIDVPEFSTSVISVNPDTIGYALGFLPRQLFTRKKVIAYWVYELEHIPETWRTAFSLIDEIWCPSAFAATSFSQYAAVPVHTVPYAIEVPKPVPASAISRTRGALEIPKEAFVFLTSADPRSILERKNPLAVVRAFKKAFPNPLKSEAVLVVKIEEPANQDEHYVKLMAEISGCANIRLVNRLLRRQELYQLMDSADAYVSLHRAEGFGLMPAEAMSRGKPVIVTAWSGPCDYIEADNCCPVGFSFVPVGLGQGSYCAEARWASPDIEEASDWMRRLVQSRFLAQAIGERARVTMQTRFSADGVGRQLKTIPN